MKNKNMLCLLVAPCLIHCSIEARVGDDEAALVQRYGSVWFREPAQKSSQGRTYKYGEYIHFRSDDWMINALVINGRCEETTYSKSGDWTDAQITHVLEINGGRSEWQEQPKPRPTAPRQWKRKDKVMATWSGSGFEIKSPLVEQTRESIVKAAKEEASKLPKF